MKLHNFQRRFINSVIVRTTDIRFDIRTNNFRLLWTSHQTLYMRHTLRVYSRQTQRNTQETAKQS